MDNATDAAKRSRSLVDREEGLINDRIGWLLTSQTIFFAGAQISEGKLGHLLGYVAIASCGLIYISILAGLVAMRNFRKIYPEDPEVVGPLSTHTFGLATPFLLPPMFVAVWIIYVLKEPSWLIMLLIVWFVLGFYMSLAAGRWQKKHKLQAACS
jgi:hypothetical protein